MKKDKWIRIRVPFELHELFKYAASLDIDSMSLTHFAILAMKERASQVLAQHKEKEEIE